MHHARQVNVTMILGAVLGLLRAYRLHRIDCQRPAQGRPAGCHADAALAPVLDAAQRGSVYAIKVIDVPYAFVGLHARTVILISRPALGLMSDDELRALVAHEYVHGGYERATAEGRSGRLQDLELVCDIIAVMTLRAIWQEGARSLRASKNSYDSTTFTSAARWTTRITRAPCFVDRWCWRSRRESRESQGVGDNERPPSRRRFGGTAFAWLAQPKLRLGVSRVSEGWRREWDSSAVAASAASAGLHRVSAHPAVARP